MAETPMTTAAARPGAEAELARVLTAIYRVHTPNDRGGVTTCNAENNEQEWPCETVAAVHRALNMEAVKDV